VSREPTAPIYEGKAKQLLKGPAPNQYILRFKNSATAFNNKKKAEIEKKGELNQQIAAAIFEYLSKNGVPSHFIKSLSKTEMLVKAVKIIPIEVVIRNVAAGSICKRYGIPEKTKFEPPIVEFFYKKDELDDPLMNEEHVRIMNLASENEVKKIKELGLLINKLLRQYFNRLGILLVDFKLEFGKDEKGNLLLADEITPDGCRLWDVKTMNILDKDRFRKDMGGLAEAYQDVLHRIEGVSR
jgi:phosphoribosylaminoimidazole-succinocarboxamide synthase